MAREENVVDTHLHPHQGVKTIIADGGEETLQVIITEVEDKIINEIMTDIVQIVVDKSDHRHNRKYKKKLRSQLPGSRLRDKQSTPVEFICLLSKCEHY